MLRGWKPWLKQTASRFPKVFMILLKGRPNLSSTTLVFRRSNRISLMPLILCLKAFKKMSLNKRKNANFFKLTIEIFILVLAVLGTLVYGNFFVSEPAKAQVTAKTEISERFLVLVKPFNLASKGSDLDYIAKASTDQLNSTLS